MFLNMITNVRYIGQSVNLQKRKRNHLSLLRNDRHNNSYLQGAFKKYGELSFEYSVLEYCPPDALTEREQNWMDFFGIGALYNFNPFATKGWCIGHTEETRRKISAANMGNRISDEARARLSMALKGKPKSVEHRANLSAAHKGKKRQPHSPETRAKISTALKYRSTLIKSRSSFQPEAR